VSPTQKFMKELSWLLLASLVIFGGCGMPKETRRGVGNEGHLIIQAVPEDAEVYVDGQLMGGAGKYENDPLELGSGTHKIELRKVGYLSEVREIYVGNQSRHTLKVNLRKSP
jgi:PEGA domain